MLVKIRLSENLKVKLKCTDLTTLATQSHLSFLREGQHDPNVPIGGVLHGLECTAVYCSNPGRSSLMRNNGIAQKY